MLLLFGLPKICKHYEATKSLVWVYINVIKFTKLIIRQLHRKLFNIQYILVILQMHLLFAWLLLSLIKRVPVCSSLLCKVSNKKLNECVETKCSLSNKNSTKLYEIHKVFIICTVIINIRCNVTLCSLISLVRIEAFK